MRSFFQELKRRHVIRVAAIYIALGWFLAEVAGFAADTFDAPDWVVQMFSILILLGFPLVLVGAWAFEITPEGLKLDRDVDRGDSIPPPASHGRADPQQAPEQDRVTASEETSSDDREAPLVEAHIPSIAVLPFVNMSGEAEQEFFADGLTEDIITELSRFHELLVISRTAVFEHKGKPVKPQAIAREFNVDYVVEGSVRKVGDRVRITVQLIDGETEAHAWAERYDRKLEDVFAIQDEVTSAIVATLSGRVEAAHQDRVQRKPTENLAAYEYVLKGKLLHHKADHQANTEALDMLDRAIALDPNYVDAHAWKGCVLGQAWIRNWCEDLDAGLQVILQELQTALALDENDADVHRMIAAVKLNFHEFDQAFHHQERALSLNPNSDLIVVQQGEILTWLGRPEEGIDWIRKAMRLNPYHPERFWSHLGRAQYTARHYKDAIQSFTKLMAPDHTHYAFLAASSAQAGSAETASGYTHQVLQCEPGFNVDNYVPSLHYKQHSDSEHLRDGLIKAGLPKK